MLLTVWLQKGKELVAPKVVTAEWSVKSISEAYFGVAYSGAFSYCDIAWHCVVYTEPEKIGTPEGSKMEVLWFPTLKRDMKRMKKIYHVEPLPSHERKKLSVEGV